MGSLQSTVNALPSSSELSALSDGLTEGLTDLLERIETLETSLENVASEEDLNEINSNIGDVQEDLDELLTSSNIYSSDIYVNNIATLDFADALGDKLNIVNGNVEIYAIPEMDSIKLQNVVNRLKTIVGGFGYLSKNTTVATVKFDSIVSTSGISIGVHHDISFANLANNGDIRFGTNYDNKVKEVNLGKLAMVGQVGMANITNNPNAGAGNPKIFGTFSTANAIVYDNADSMDLGSLPYYSQNALTLTLDSGGDLNIGSLDDTDSTGRQTDLDLTITGAAIVSLPNYDDGDFSATDVGTVDLPKFTGDSGSITLSQITHLKLGAVEVDVKIGTSSTPDNDLETFDVTAAKGTDTNDTAPEIAVYSTSVENVKVAGVTGAVTLADSPSLDTVDFSAKAVGTITLNNNANLVNVTLTGEAPAVVVTNNADLQTLTIGTKTVVSSAKDAKLDGTITVTDNASLANLTVESDDIENLSITGNPDLTQIDLSKLTKIGATGKPTVNIYNNDLTASKLTDDNDGTTDVANGATGDKGSITSSSGMDTAKVYLGVVAADADATANVYFDTVDEFADAETSTISTTTNHKYSGGTTPSNSELDQIKVLVISAASSDGVAAKDASKGKKSWVFSSTSGAQLQISSGNPTTTLFAVGGSTSSVTLSGNAAIDVNAITTAENLARANAAGLTLTAQKGGQSTLGGDVTLRFHAIAPPLIIGERHTTTAAATAAASSTNHGLGPDDEVTFTVGMNSVTVSGVVVSSAPHLVALGTTIQAAYLAKYGPAGTHSATAVASVNHAGGVLSITGLDPGSRGHGLEVSLSVKAGTATITNGLALDWTIGSTNATTDNSTDSNNFIVTLESLTAGPTPSVSDATTPTTILLGGAAVTVSRTLVSTQLTNGTDPNKGTYTAQTESRADVTIAEASTAVVAPTTAAVSFSRVGWL